MLKTIPYVFTLASCLMASSPVVPDNYFLHEDKKISYLYAEEHKTIVPALKAYQSTLMKYYEAEFGYSFDSPMFVGLASSNNQIANGFSTPFPFNSQLYYTAGASKLDYFTSTSWLKTLAIHETAHNFQLNTEGADYQKLLYKLLGRGFFTILGIPSSSFSFLTQSALMQEGNAVMNESRFNNGGRLYSGYALANVLSLAQAESLSPALVFNPVMKFPYGERFYLVGGFYQDFLVKKYGISKVNGYFKARDSFMLGFFTNHIHQSYFGKSFEALFLEFTQSLKQKHKGFHQTQGVLVAQSQIQHPMNQDNEMLLTLNSDLHSASTIMQYNKNTNEVTYLKGNWRNGEVFVKDKRYYTQTSAHVNPGKIEMGLYDSELRQKAGSGSKVLQGTMPDKREVTIDVKSSVESPRIYIGDTYYGQSHSSVYVSQEGDLYYFKQKGHKRTLYKNKTALYSYIGHYGFVSDVDGQGAIYFIGNSAHGSTAYRYTNNRLTRVSKGDDVIDFKHLGKQKGLVATIGANGYSYRRISLIHKNASIAKPDYHLEAANKSLPQETQTFKKQKSLPAVPYNALKQLDYSYSEQSMNYNEINGLQYTATFHFADPLKRNTFSTLLAYEDTRQVFGLAYQNNSQLLTYGTSFYVLNHDDDYIFSERNHGYNAYAQYPFLRRGYWSGSATISHTKAFYSLYRSPTTFSMDLVNRKHFGMSKLPNSLNTVNAFVSKDRESLNYGAAYRLIQEVCWQ